MVVKNITASQPADSPNVMGGEVCEAFVDNTPSRINNDRNKNMALLGFRDNNFTYTSNDKIGTNMINSITSNPETTLPFPFPSLI